MTRSRASAGSARRSRNSRPSPLRSFSGLPLTPDETASPGSAASIGFVRRSACVAAWPASATDGHARAGSRTPATGHPRAARAASGRLRDRSWRAACDPATRASRPARPDAARRPPRPARRKRQPAGARLNGDLDLACKARATTQPTRCTACWATTGWTLVGFRGGGADPAAVDAVEAVPKRYACRAGPAARCVATSAATSRSSIASDVSRFPNDLDAMDTYCGRRNCERLEREHRRRDLTRGRIGNRRRSLFQHEQPRTGDLTRERFAVADREERIAATVHHQRRVASSDRRSRHRGLQLSLENTMPIWLAICTAGSVPGVRSQMRSAVARAAAGSSPRISAPPAAYSATAARSDQSGIERENSRSIVAASWSGRSPSTGLERRAAFRRG